MQEEHTTQSPTRIKITSCRKQSKGMDDGGKGHCRLTKSAHFFKPVCMVFHSQTQPDSTNPSHLNFTEGPRKAKSNHAALPVNTAALQTPLSKHPQPPTSHPIPNHHPPPSHPLNSYPPPNHSHASHPLPSHPPSHPPVSLQSSLTLKSSNEPSSNTHKGQSSSSNFCRRPPLASYSSVPAQPQHLDPSKQRFIDRAIKARLYFLRQSGPNKFLIGGDSMDSRFHVSIGPQTCSCNKPHCVHLLFVMLRVLKVKQSSPMLWAKQLRNYEVETLLGEFQTRVDQRTATPRKGSRKKFDFLKRPELQSNSEGVAKSLSVESENKAHSPANPGDKNLLGVTPGNNSTEAAEGVDNKDDEDAGDSEDICPICLNELDEGEDLLICSGCNNHLHQHCMDIWAMEERRKNEQVHCPVCRALWPYPQSSPSSNLVLDSMPVSVPVEGAESTMRGSGPVGVILGDNKITLLESLKDLFGCSGLDNLFSSEWKAREMALSLISREAVSLLMSGSPSSSVEVLRTRENKMHAYKVQRVCMEVVKYSCNDSVLKVFLASLELLKVVLAYSHSSSQTDSQHLQELLKPILLCLLTRCADAQRRVKDCSIEAVCNFCLGQEGALSVGSALGQHSSLPVTSARYVLQVALSGQEKGRSWHWWLGRLTFMDQILSGFSYDFLISQCVLKPEPIQFDSDSDDTGSGSGLVSPSGSIASGVAVSITSTEHSVVSELGSVRTELHYSDDLEPEQNLEEADKFSSQSLRSSLYKSLVENNLLMQMWYFSASATHISRPKIAKVARRVIVRISKLLRDDPTSLEIVHDVVSRCHRTAAEGLLDRVLQAREVPLEPSPLRNKNRTEKRSLGVQQRTDPDTRLSPNHEQRENLTPESPSLDRKSKGRSASPRGREKSPVTKPTVQGTEERSKNSDGDGGNKKDEVSTNVVPSPPNGATSVAADKDVNGNAGGTMEGGKVGRQRSKAGPTDDFVASDESFQSAVSELDLDCSNNTITMPPEVKGDELGGVVEDESSSASNSHDSKVSSESHKLSSHSSGISVGKGVESGFPIKPGYMDFPHMYMRQSTADSTSSESLEGGWSFNACKRTIEEEEAEALAKVRSMEEEEVPHPPLSGLIPPNPEVLIHVQQSGKDDSDDSMPNRPYIEGVHWVKGKLIGTGAFCTCFLARDTNNATMFAVKQVSYVRNTRSQEEEELSRLRDEISMLGRINHPNIVRCLGATQHDGHINIFIEWMAGGCLDQLLHDFGSFGENVICNYSKQITRGIVFLHESGIIHRDLKGGNILVDSTGRRLRIADFGAAARLATHTTGSGEFQNMEGTVAFMAPEVVRGGSDVSSGYGRKCDVWSIGCVVIQMATAKPPWTGTYDMKNKFQLIFKIGQATSPPPLPEFTNPALKDFTIRCLEVRPDDRPTSTELLRHPLFTAF